MIVGVRKPRDDLYQTLIEDPQALETAGIASVTRIGDALAPGAIVHAVHSGHHFAREFDRRTLDADSTLTPPTAAAAAIAERAALHPRLPRP